MNESKSGHSFPTHLFQLRFGWPGPLLTAQGARWAPTLDRMPLTHHRVQHPHTHSDKDNVDTTMYLMCTSLGRGKKWSPRRKPKGHGENMHTPQDSGQNWEPIVSSHQCYN